MLRGAKEPPWLVRASWRAGSHQPASSLTLHLRLQSGAGDQSQQVRFCSGGEFQSAARQHGSSCRARLRTADTPDPVSIVSNSCMLQLSSSSTTQWCLLTCWTLSVSTCPCPNVTIKSLDSKYRSNPNWFTFLWGKCFCSLNLVIKMRNFLPRF